MLKPRWYYNNSMFEKYRTSETWLWLTKADDSFDIWPVNHGIRILTQYLEYCILDMALLGEGAGLHLRPYHPTITIIISIQSQWCNTELTSTYGLMVLLHSTFPLEDCSKIENCLKQIIKAVWEYIGVCTTYGLDDNNNTTHCIYKHLFASLCGNDL